MIEDSVDERYNYPIVDYMRKGVNLVVETEGDEMLITHSDLSPRQMWELMVFLVDKFSIYTGIDYNSVCEDLKEIEEGE